MCDINPRVVPDFPDRPRPIAAAPRARARTIVSALALVALATSGLGMTCGPDPGPTPCELDRLGCDDEDPDADDFYLASCPADVSGPLEVELGSGEAAFAPFATGEGPVINYGPQGGQHVFMGLRVTNARVDVSPSLRISYYLGQGAGCAPPADAGTNAPLALPSCAVTLGKRDLRLGEVGYELRTNAAGDVEEYGLVVFVDIPDPALPGVVAVSVEDQCRRGGAAYQVWTSYRL